MIRVLALLLVVASGSAAAWVWKLGRNSFSGFSDHKLAVLGVAYLEQVPTGPAGVSDAEVSLSLLKDEQRRRMLQLPITVAAVISVVLLGWSLLRRDGRSTSGGGSDEERRLQAQFGSPELLEAGARNKAAELLGCHLQAPPEVIIAAYEAQLRLRDASRMDGLAPDLQRLAIQQREALTRARDLLLKK